MRRKPISPWRHSIWMVPVLTALLSATSSAQDNQAPVIRTTTRLVQLDAVVLDKQNRPVTGLTKDDFLVFDNGTEQKVAHFAAASGAHPTQPPPKSAGGQPPSDVQAPGVTAVLIDELVLDSFTRQEPKPIVTQMRLQVQKFLSTLQPGELVGIYAQRREGVVVIRDITDDPASLAVAEKWLGGEGTQGDAGSPDSADADIFSNWKQSAPAVPVEQNGPPRESHERVLSGGGLQAVVKHMREFPGRKSLVWISATFPLPATQFSFGAMAKGAEGNVPNPPGPGTKALPEPHHADTQGHFNEMQELARVLGSVNVAVYPLDAYGLTVEGSPEGQDAFADLIATESGGRAIFDTNGVVENLRKIVAEGDGAYQMGYYPGDKAWDGSYHRIELKLTPEHKDLKLMFRKGYYAIDAPEPPSYEIYRQAAIRDVEAPPKVTVAMLEQVLAAAKGKPDKAAAKEISKLSLGERIGEAQYEKLSAEISGPESRTALLALADAAEFLDLPPAEIPATPPPTIDEQRDIVVRAVQFAANNVHQMPDLLATRNITQYQHIQYAPETWTRGGVSSDATSPEFNIEGPFRQIGKSQVTVVYRDGHEVVENQRKNQQTRNYGVTSRGAFGELLRLVITDLVASHIRWSHWEDGKTGKLAVFDFEVPKGKANYEWSYCCTVDRDGNQKLVAVPAAYSAEVAIDLKTAAILRMVVKTQPDNNVVLKASEVVEYGPVEIAGKTYICPMKNVVLFVARDYDAEIGEFGDVGKPDSFSAVRATNTPFVAIDLNHASFENYHVFRSEVRIVSDDEQNAPASEPASIAKPASPH